MVTLAACKPQMWSWDTVSSQTRKVIGSTDGQGLGCLLVALTTESAKGLYPFFGGVTS